MVIFLTFMGGWQNCSSEKYVKEKKKETHCCPGSVQSDHRGKCWKKFCCILYTEVMMKRPNKTRYFVMHILFPRNHEYYTNNSTASLLTRLI